MELTQVYYNINRNIIIRTIKYTDMDKARHNQERIDDYVTEIQFLKYKLKETLGFCDLSDLSDVMSSKLVYDLLNALDNNEIVYVDNTIKLELKESIIHVKERN